MKTNEDDYTPSRLEANLAENDWEKYDEMKENDEFECNCSDPSCPCNGFKIGRL